MSDDIEGFGAKRPPTRSDEVSAILTVENILVDTDKGVAVLEKDDKHPNEDGHIDLLDGEGKTIGRILVQVKKLPDNAISPPKLPRCPVKTLKSSKAYASPFILIAVDITNGVAYWEHIDDSYLDQLDIKPNQKSKTIHFSQNKTVNPDDLQFIEDWRDIVESNKKGPFYEKYKELENKANPAIKESKPAYRNVHQFLDLYNDMIGGIYPIVKDRYYPNSWKIGMAINKYNEEMIEYSLYPIPDDTNDLQIKEIDADSFREIMDEIEGAHSAQTAYPNPLISEPQLHARERVNDDLLDLVEDKNLKHVGSLFLAREHIFDFIRKYNALMGLELKDEYSVGQITDGMRFLQIWVDEYIQQKETVDWHTVLRDGFVHLDIIQDDLNKVQKKSLIRRARERLDDEKSLDYKYPVGDRWRNPNQIRESLRQIQSKDIIKISSPYKYPDYSAVEGDLQDLMAVMPQGKENLQTVFNAYPEDAIRHNHKQLFENVVPAYNSIVEANFPELADELSLFVDRATHILVLFRVPDSEYDGMLPPALSIYPLRNENESSEPVSFDIYEEGTIDIDLLGKTIELHGKEYARLGTKMTRSGYIYSNYPATDFIYDELESQLENHFDA